MYQIVTDQYGRVQGLLDSRLPYVIPKGWSVTDTDTERDSEAWLLSLPVINA